MDMISVPHSMVTAARPGPKNIEKLKSEVQAASRSQEMRRLVHLFYLISFDFHGGEDLVGSHDELLEERENADHNAFNAWIRRVRDSRLEIKSAPAAAAANWNAFMSTGCPPDPIFGLLLKTMAYTTPVGRPSAYVPFDALEDHRRKLTEHARAYSVYSHLALGLNGAVPDRVLWSTEQAPDTDRYTAPTGLVEVRIDGVDQSFFVKARNRTEMAFLKTHFETQEKRGEHSVCGGQIFSFADFIDEIGVLDDDCDDGTVDIATGGGSLASRSTERGEGAETRPGAKRPRPRQSRQSRQSRQDYSGEAANPLEYDRVIDDPNTVLRPNPGFIAYVRKALGYIMAPIKDEVSRRNLEIAFMFALGTDGALESIFSDVVIRTIASQSTILDPAERGIRGARGQKEYMGDRQKLSASIWRTWEYMKGKMFPKQDDIGPGAGKAAEISFFKENMLGLYKYKVCVEWEDIYDILGKMDADTYTVLSLLGDIGVLIDVYNISEKEESYVITVEVKSTVAPRQVGGFIGFIGVDMGVDATYEVVRGENLNPLGFVDEIALKNAFKTFPRAGFKAIEEFLRKNPEAPEGNLAIKYILEGIKGIRDEIRGLDDAALENADTFAKKTSSAWREKKYLKNFVLDPEFIDDLLGVVCRERKKAEADANFISKLPPMYRFFEEEDNGVAFPRSLFKTRIENAIEQMLTAVSDIFDNKSVDEYEDDGQQQQRVRAYHVFVLQNLFGKHLSREDDKNYKLTVSFYPEIGENVGLHDCIVNEMRTNP